MGLCVYCDKDKSLTREHILPSFVYKYQESNKKGKTSGWREKPQKIIGGEAVIKDVCAECNNVVLGALDGHAKHVLEKAGVFTSNFKKSTLYLEYNYNELSRWLLKVAYNSSRASGKHQGVFEKFKGFILEESSDSSQFIISVGLFKSLKLTKDQYHEYGKDLDADEHRYVNPFYPRISWAPQTPAGFSVKQIVIGALVFHVVIFNDGISRDERKRLIKQYLEICKGMSLLRKNEKKAKVCQIPLTFIDSMQHHMLRPEVEPHLAKLLT
ncbi:hypothetical protein [Shewanella sp. MBTL60-007]|uniref:hypothetical protein n=1 Tax=Shewanella sp. MBTL60-007 TaxID=2815911 RepID=UPI001BC065DC|nr:hypothetical protein [Shewanella sp. MBTL60-007]GIU32363.1 hypothetical protein TUM3792_44830 [Shewanella sp. MBTL60-007]